MSKKHQSKVPPGLECKAYMFDIDETCYAEYQTSDGLWHPSPYCDDVIEHLLNTGFTKYLEDIDKATCKSGLQRVIKNGPPLWLEDSSAFKVPEGTHIQKVWFMKNNEEKDAKYKDAPEGEERLAMWEKHKLLLETLPESDDEEDEVLQSSPKKRKISD